MRTQSKTFAFDMRTPDRASAARMKKGLTIRCASEKNAFEALRISAGHGGRVQGEIQYTLATGAATPTHIRDLLAGVAGKQNVDVLDLPDVSFLKPAK